MDQRQEELTKLKTYIERIDNDLTMILQTLQWDRKQLLQSPALATCRYDSNHKVPPDKTEEHEKECFLRQNGYSKDDKLLPDPLDLESSTLVKLRKEDIEQIIANASRSDKLFKRGVGCGDAEPLSLERLQSSYSADERRAIHDAVVSAVPSCHDLTDLALLSAGDDKSSKVVLSRQEILLELRNMRRRRTKYRVAAKSRNYSDVLRDVIKTQMEHYNDAKTETDPKATVEQDTHNAREYSRGESKDCRYRNDGKSVPGPIKIKIERNDSAEGRYRQNYQRDYRERSDKPYRYETESRDRRDRDYDRSERHDRSRERRNYDELERSEKYGEHSRKRRHENESRERRNYYEDSEERRKESDPEKEYISEKRSRKSHRHKDYDSEYERNDEGNAHRRERSQEKRHDDKKNKAYKHKDKKDRHRERSKERRRDRRYEEKSSERIHIKQEREDSVTRDEADAYGKNKSKDRSRKKKDKRHDRSHRDERNYDGRSVEVKQEIYDRYYDVPSEQIYDPHKNIKVEQ